MDDKRRIARREALAMLGAAGAAFALGCADDTLTGPSSDGSTGGGTGDSAACAVTPNETVGPYPSLTDLVRSDIREDRMGTRLTLTITVVNASTNCSPVENANVEIWQCDAAGSYSQYGAARSESYLRGIQTTNANGEVTFTTIYPGWYQGRATHIHVEVVRNGSSVKVTQIAFPESVNAAVYGSGVYATRGSNPVSNTLDTIFADSLNSELATISGEPAGGYAATFRIAV